MVCIYQLFNRPFVRSSSVTESSYRKYLDGILSKPGPFAGEDYEGGPEVLSNLEQIKILLVDCGLPTLQLLTDPV